MLTLPIKKKWFDMIVSGEKKEEYRKIKPYYDSRFSSYTLENYPKFELINGGKYTLLFRNGYGKDKPTILCQCEISKGYGKEEWGAEQNKEYYVLKILSVERVVD